ncbi:MAG: 6-carboxytetrahydropterin synthase [Bdellovibrionales bacterium]|nr:6-carboxytetrahydropterin synthase [Bdellovibrionales bacterium]
MRELFVRNLTNLDFAWLDPKKGLMGESLIVNVFLQGEMDERGFIMDFGPCKKWMKQLIDHHLDHTCVVPMRSSHLKIAGLDEVRMSFSFHWAQGELSYEAPRHTLVLLEKETLEISDFAEFLETQARQALPDRVKDVKIELLPDPNFKTSANYRYTHGLKLHEGNCQRLFHGHRNPIEVYLNDIRQEKMEVYLSDYLKQIHFAPLSSVTSETQDLLLNQRNWQSNDQLTLSYEAPQGLFKAELPVRDCLIMAEEPSIERITELSWKILKEEFAIADSSTLKVYCFEGLSKGCSFQN